MFLLILYWFSVSVVDMHGRDAAATINNALSAITIHRRGLQLDGKFFDLHCRITDAVVAGGHFNDDYMAALGYELASLDKTVFEEVVNLMRRQLGTGEVTGFGQQPLLIADGDVYGLFLRLRTTLLFSLLRNYMGKLHMGCQHLLICFLLGPYKRGFVNLDCLYIEPMVAMGQTRIMLFLGQKTTIYDTCPVGRRGGDVVDTSPLVAPQYLDRSL